MCAFFNICNYPFKWITYLVSVLGIYTFLHWFLAVPLLHSHFIECCDKNWPKNWLVWFLLISFACWIGISILILLIWCCLKKCTDTNEPTVRFENGTQKAILEKENVQNNIQEKKPTEILTLPEFDSRGSFTILQMNDVQPEEKPVTGSGLPIPLDESCEFVQSGSPVRLNEVKSPKTPREIFFQDLLEGAAKSTYFDFDPEKVADSILEKANLSVSEENTYFVGGPTEKETVTSEVFIKLNEKEIVVEPLGQFQVLKD